MIEKVQFVERPEDLEETEETTDYLDEEARLERDITGQYLHEIGRVALLTAEQEVELAKRIEAGLFAAEILEAMKLVDYSQEELDNPEFQAELAEIEWLAKDGREARAHMYLANLRLVVSVAKRYSRPEKHLKLLDLAQEGNVGLMRAVERFNYTKGVKFSTYATWWIRQAIFHANKMQERLVRLPVWIEEAITQIKMQRDQMTRDLGREPSNDEIAIELGITPEKVEKLLKLDRKDLSLNQPVDEDGQTEFGDLLQDSGPDFEDRIHVEAQPDYLVKVLENFLSPREALVVTLRLGLLDGKQLTLKEVGQILGVSGVMVRKIEKRALSKLGDRDVQNSIAELIA